MAICYSYLLLLLFLLLITWTSSTSLRHYLRSPSKWSLERRYSINESTTSEPVLSRRRPFLPSSERRRRWSKDDEVEIPIDDILSFNSTITSEQSDNLIEDSTTMQDKYPYLRQDLTELNQTNEENSQNNTQQSTIVNEIINLNSTESEIVSANVTDTIDNVTNIEIIRNETETSASPISINQTIEETTTIPQTNAPIVTTFDQDTAIIIFDYITNPPHIAEEDQTSINPETKSVPEYNTTVIDEGGNTTIVSDVAQTDTLPTQAATDNSANKLDTVVIGDTTMNSEVIQNDTSTVITDEDEYSNETISLPAKPAAKPICDRSCQCLKECPHGFEIIDNKCKCDPPCKNYQCFGNDTCTVTKNGQPLCQSEDGTEHDRPIRCYQPQDAGHHDADMRYQDRWYYHPDQDTCHLFVYRGLGGNKNNFQTLHECHLECITCAPAPDSGTCSGHMLMWYYDNKKNQCTQFRYTGCKGNDNRFYRKQECIDTCVTRIINL